MEGLAITDKGAEFAVLAELGKGKAEDCAVTFKVKDELELCKFAYTTQASRRVLLLLGSFEFDSLDSLLAQAKTLLPDYKWLKGPFRATCQRLGEHTFSGRDVEEELGGIIIDKYKFKVSLTAPKTVFYCFINESKAYFGIELSGRDLSKRDYMVYAHPNSVRGDLAAALLKMAGYKPGMLLLDPFSGDGAVVIEAAIMASKRPVQFYSKDLAFTKLLKNKKEWDAWFKEMDGAQAEAKGIHAFDNMLRNVRHGKNNAKIAGVDKWIEFSKVAVGWLDTRFKHGEVEVIATRLPGATQKVPEAKLKPIYDEFFYQARYVLGNGTLAALIPKKELFLEAGERHGFKLKEEKEIVTGEMKYFLLKL
ncbi:THUMP domain-containing protein [Nanoarchaeota archaeon]